MQVLKNGSGYCSGTSAAIFNSVFNATLLAAFVGVLNFNKAKSRID
jgi:hypothetical protein